MFLYHGTWENNKEDILESGIIKNEHYSIDDTELLNEVFEEYLGYNPRNLCVYLSNDEDTMDGYDFGFRINSNKLNTNLLYVGSNKIVQEIYMEIMSQSPNKKKIRKLTKSYEDTLISFSDFLDSNGTINSDLEFLYFESIEVSEENLF